MGVLSQHNNEAHTPIQGVANIVVGTAASAAHAVESAHTAPPTSPLEVEVWFLALIPLLGLLAVVALLPSLMRAKAEHGGTAKSTPTPSFQEIPFRSNVVTHHVDDPSARHWKDGKVASGGT